MSCLKYEKTISILFYTLRTNKELVFNDMNIIRIRI